MSLWTSLWSKYKMALPVAANGFSHRKANSSSGSPWPVHATQHNVSDSLSKRIVASFYFTPDFAITWLVLYSECLGFKYWPRDRPFCRRYPQYPWTNWSPLDWGTNSSTSLRILWWSLQMLLYKIIRYWKRLYKHPTDFFRSAWHFKFSLYIYINYCVSWRWEQ
jgi:hypothetical protein